MLEVSKLKLWSHPAFRSKFLRCQPCTLNHTHVKLQIQQKNWRRLLISIHDIKGSMAGNMMTRQHPLSQGNSILFFFQPQNTDMNWFKADWNETASLKSDARLLKSVPESHTAVLTCCRQAGRQAGSTFLRRSTTTLDLERESLLVGKEFVLLVNG